MFFQSVFVIFSLFIGSSVFAATNEERVKSLQQLHPPVLEYVQNLAKVYDQKGFDSLKNKRVYTTFNNQSQLISTLLSKVQNQGFSSESKETTAVTEAINSWKEKAINAIDECINNAATYISRVDNNTRLAVRSRITDFTIKVMDSINNRNGIIADHQKSSCPIYAKCRTIVSNYGDEENVLSEFERLYG